MSETTPQSSPNLTDVLRKFKPLQKPKLTHMIMSSSSSSSSSSEGSPVTREKPTIMVISDSESESDAILCIDSDDNDCVIVPTNAGVTSSKEDDSLTKSTADNLTSASPCSVKEEKDVDMKLNTPVKEQPEDPVNQDVTKKSTPKKRNRRTPKKSPKAGDSAEKNVNKEDSSEDDMSHVKRKKKAITNRRKKKSKMDYGSDMDAEFHANENTYDSDDEVFGASVKKSQRVKVVELLNKGTEPDFSGVATMNAKRMALVESKRPYTNWHTVVRIFKETQGLSSTVLGSICDLIIAKDIVLDLMSRCEELASKTNRKISNSGSLVTTQPSLLNSEMKLSNYQLVGLNWLALMRSRCLNSILADEMGLGKTIQVIAFLAYLKQEELTMSGYPHLVVVPSSTLNNWYDEFQRWCPSLNITIYHGNQMERRYMRHVWFKEGFGDADVILTTYSCAISSREEKKMFRIKEFNYIIFDEAHMLKNMNTQRYEALMEFNGNFKILLTGTPLQNNLLELMSLLIFLMPNIFAPKVQHIKLLFAKAAKNINEQSSDFEKEKVNQAKRIIEPFMLRRLKEVVLRDLPKKTVSVEMCSMLPDQKEKYYQVAEEFKESMKSDDTNTYLVYFTLLRKMANHPLLLRYYFTEDKLQKMAALLATDSQYKGKNPQYIQEDLYFKSDFELYFMCQDYESLHSLEYSLPEESFCQSGKLDKLTPMLHSLKEGGHRVLIFSQFILMLDILQEYCKIQNFSFLRMDGSTPTDVRQELIDLFNVDNEIFVFLLSTKAGGLGINLTAADTVIIHDVDFNPYNDKQAEDRCHRVGQKRPVQVVKMVSEGTVEEGMYNTAVRKLHLEKEITAGRTGDDDSDSKTIVQLLKESLGLTENV